MALGKRTILFYQRRHLLLFSETWLALEEIRYDVKYASRSVFHLREEAKFIKAALYIKRMDLRFPLLVKFINWIPQKAGKYKQLCRQSMLDFRNQYVRPVNWDAQIQV